MTFRFDLSAKLALVLLLWVSAFALPWAVQATLVLLIIAARYAIPAYKPQSSRASSAFTRFLFYSAAAAVLIIVLNAALMSGGAQWRTILGMTFHEEGFTFGIRTICRLLLLSFSILVFFVSTPLPELVHFLQHRGMSPSLTMILLLTLHFLDQLPAKIHQIFLAQQARGAPVDANLLARTRALLTILSPLVLSSIVESIERGTALELRGFLHRRRAKPDNSEEKGRNLLTATLLILSLIVIIVALAQWLLR